MPASRGFRKVACWLAGLARPSACCCRCPPAAPHDYDVDLALVLAIDCSFSVDAHEFAVQMRGLGRAFMSER